MESRTPDPAAPRGRRLARATGFGYLDDELGRVLAMAHRGGGGFPDLPGLENTLPAFRRSVALGYRYLETDVHATADGVLVAFHDPVLDRVTDRSGAIADLAYAEVAQARIAGTEPIPTMAALLEEFPDARFNIDIKAPRAAAALAELIGSTRTEGRVLVGSFSWWRLREFRRLTSGRVPTSATTAEAAAFVASPSGHLARLLTFGRPAVLQLPHVRHGFPIVTASLVRRAHAAGLPVHVWTVDEPAEMHALLDLGVDGLITDRPDLLRAELTTRGLWDRG